jgi:hypothetical protein
MLTEASTVYFCFTEDGLDQPQHPNKLVLARNSPSVYDTCGTIKVLFFPNQVSLYCLVHPQGRSVKMFFCSWTRYGSFGVPRTESGPGTNQRQVRHTFHFNSAYVSDMGFTYKEETEGNMKISPQFVQGRRST